MLFFLLYNIVCKASRRSFLFSFTEIVFGFGPKITPPPFHNGERFEPARARPRHMALFRAGGLYLTLYRNHGSGNVAAGRFSALHRIAM